MITADTLKKLTSLKKEAVVSALESTRETPSWAYAIKKIKFLGLTNGGHFCYGLDYDGRMAINPRHARRPEKVFVTLTATGSLIVTT